MAYTPYDWQQTLHQKADYVEDRLHHGSPVVGISGRDGILLVTVQQNQRKIFEIYDRLAFSGLGQQSDLEAVRQLLVDFTHAEGFQRSTEDVSIQRVVGLAISPALKRAFSDPTRIPLVLRGLFAQVGDQPAEDLFYTLNYDGEFMLARGHASIAGTEPARAAMEKVLSDLEPAPALETALPMALQAWSAGRWVVQHSANEKETVAWGSEADRRALLAKALESGTIAAALLERHTQRERRFRLLDAGHLQPYLP
jgi:proteasome alpha subunit